MIDIMCNILGSDEYLYRLIDFEGKGKVYYLIWTRNVPEGLNIFPSALDTQNGDIFYKDENDEKHIIANIFTSEQKEEPFRLSEYNKNWLVDQFIINILNHELPDGVEVTVGYDGAHDMYFSTYKMVDGEKDYLEDYWVNEETGEVFSDRGEFCGIMFD